jgi:hypothetical protein
MFCFHLESGFECCAATLTTRLAIQDPLWRCSVGTFLHRSGNGLYPKIVSLFSNLQRARGSVPPPWGEGLCHHDNQHYHPLLLRLTMSRGIRRATGGKRAARNTSMALLFGDQGCTATVLEFLVTTAVGLRSRKSRRLEERDEDADEDEDVELCDRNAC